jgi:hypothetical protein
MQDTQRGSSLSRIILTLGAIQLISLVVALVLELLSGSTFFGSGMMVLFGLVPALILVPVIVVLSIAYGWIAISSSVRMNRRALVVAVVNGLVVIWALADILLPG